MAETHRRVVYEKGFQRVVGVFDDLKQPLFILEHKGPTDALGNISWVVHTTLPFGQVLTDKAVLYELLRTYCTNNKEKEQFGYVKN